MTNFTAEWRQELQNKLETAAQLSVSPKLWETVAELWWSRCERDEGVFEYVFTQLFGFPVKWADFGSMSPRAKRAIYAFSRPHMFPGGELFYIAHIVATILIEGNQEELLDVYNRKLLSRQARLDHQSLQTARDAEWVQEVLTMLAERNPTVRFRDTNLPVVEGEVRPG